MNKQKKKMLWTEAQRKCHLTDEAVQMAKEIGMGPSSLIKNIPGRSEAWKAPVEDWIRNLYRKKKNNATARKTRNTVETAEKPSPSTREELNDDIPF